MQLIGPKKSIDLRKRFRFCKGDGVRSRKSPHRVRHTSQSLLLRILPQNARCWYMEHLTYSYINSRQRPDLTNLLIWDRDPSDSNIIDDITVETGSSWSRKRLSSWGEFNEECSASSRYEFSADICPTETGIISWSRQAMSERMTGRKAILEI